MLLAQAMCLVLGLGTRTASRVTLTMLFALATSLRVSIYAGNHYQRYNLPHLQDEILQDFCVGFGGAQANPLSVGVQVAACRGNQ